MPENAALNDILSVQLYSLRTLGSLSSILDASKAAGFSLVETIGDQLLDHETTATLLNERGLRASSSHVGMDQLRASLDAVIEACQALEIGQIFMPAVSEPERGMPLEGWRALGAELGTMADKMAEHGLMLGYHNHDWELALQADGRTALDHLFDAAGSSSLAFQVDIAWLVRGGADPMFWLKNQENRVASAHVKDLAPAGQALEEDGWADVGFGTVDWPALWPAARSAGAAFMVVEHDKPADPAASIARSRQFLASMVGA